ncbi:hypothetical protein F5Y19DRAFT_85730 [Xylariaceae sp. FL1651]|nr:hypothetical protein F5Y19DRAFT_85730 [Xylariaceae sp. FL1651]
MKGRCSPFVLLAIWEALGSHGLAREFTTRSDDGISDIPSAQDFIRRGCHTVAVIGDYLYLDGGQVTERVNGSSPAASPSYDVNTTWSINLGQSWTNETVEIRSIPKAAPRLSKQIHWTDASTSSLYTWGGFTADNTTPSHELWRFAADGSGGGAWSQVAQQDFLTFSKLKSPFGAAFTQTKDVGYAFGGAVTQSSDSSVHKPLPGYALPGLVSYNFRTGEWGNSSTSFYGGYGTSLNARSEFVPFGPNGLLVFLGGAETPVDATNETIVEVNWNSITMVDPVTQQWYRQTTSGTKPPTVESHCSVGVQGPNGTYEIYIYGGVSDQIRDTSPDVHVLSLPGFVFFEGPSQGPPRSDHGCAVVGKGQRQMLSVGGIDGENRTFTAPTTADPWTYGIGVLDMTELQWTNSYDPDAPAYDSPTVVKDWYSAGNLEKMHWDNADLEMLFMNTPSAPTPTPSQVKSETSATGAIVGGAVGGAIGIAAIGMMSFLFMKRRRSRAETPDSSHHTAINDSDQDEIPEYKPEPWPKDVGPRYYSPDSELTAVGQPLSPLPIEIHGNWRGELSGHQDGIVPMQGGELPGTEVKVGELMDPNMQWAHELPAPLESDRTELPDRKYSQ